MNQDARLRAYYQQGYAERDRLTRREGQLEYARTLELLARFLPPSPAKVIDIGGGTGVYASWLASSGYSVDLVDVVPDHVQRAAQAGVYHAIVGDACALPVSAASYDAALLLGPLYHLLTAQERLAALHEACRVVRPDGLVVAAFISRGAVALDGHVKGWIDRPGVMSAVRDHLDHGSSTHARGFGAVSYFHLPDEARAELAAAGLDVLALLGVEGPSWVAPDFDARWQRPTGRDVMFESARLCEAEPALLAISPHLLAVARRS